jgi:hypothetical protein
VPERALQRKPPFSERIGPRGLYSLCNALRAFNAAEQTTRISASKINDRGKRLAMRRRSAYWDIERISAHSIASLG